MLIKLYRLMAPEGDPSGSGTAAPNGTVGTTAPTATPAQGSGTAAPAIDHAALAAAIAPAIAKQVHDTVFARLREAGVVGGRKEPAQTDPATTTTPNAPAAAVDFEALLERRENFAHALGRFDVPDTAIPRARKAFTSEKPEDVNVWVSTYATEMGWKQRSAQQVASATAVVAAPPAASSPPAHPVTDRSPPPPPYVVTDDTPILRMTPADRAALEKKLGTDKFVDRYMEELRTGNVRVRLS